MFWVKEFHSFPPHCLNKHFCVIFELPSGWICLMIPATTHSMPFMILSLYFSFTPLLSRRIITRCHFTDRIKLYHFIFLPFHLFSEAFSVWSHFLFACLFSSQGTGHSIEKVKYHIRLISVAYNDVCNVHLFSLLLT